MSNLLRRLVATLAMTATLILPTLLYSQGSCVSGQVIAPASDGGMPVSFAQIRVCSSSATGVPCSPLATSIFYDPALTQPITIQPFSSDINGNWQFCSSIASSLLTFNVQATVTTGLIYAYYITLPASTSVNLSSPPPIGNITPNVGDFTDILAQLLTIGSVPSFSVTIAAPSVLTANYTQTLQAKTGTLADLSDIASSIATNFASPPPLGNTAPNTGAFTVLTATSAQIAALGSITPGTVNATAMTAQSVNGILGIANFGIKCDGLTDDSAGLNLIGSSIPAAGWTVAFPAAATCLHSASITTWAKPNLTILMNGSRLKFTGSGRQIYLHSGLAELDNLHLLGMVLQGNASTTHNLYSDTLIARGEIEIINAQDATTACVYAGGVGSWQLMNKVSLTCSFIKASAMGVPQTTTPSSGLILGDTGAPFTNNRNVNITSEGASGIAVWCKFCYENVFTGTGEDAATGLQVEALSSHNIWLAFDTEANSVQDVLEKGSAEVFINATSTSVFNTSGTFQLEISHGIFQTIHDDGGSTYANIHDVSYAYISGAGDITGFANVGSRITNSINATTQALFRSANAPAPFTDIFQSTRNSSATARNWCWSPDATGLGFYELWAGSNTSISCVAGSPVMQFVPGGHLRLPGQTLSFGGGTDLATSTAIPTVGTPVLTQAACYFAAGPPVQLGHCTSVVGAGGACTCVFP